VVRVPVVSTGRRRHARMIRPFVNVFKSAG
jgi:hypothetical protein